MFGSRKPTVLMKGTLAERSWASTLATISDAGHNGQLTLKSDGKVYQVAFANGRIVGAVSPAPADTVQRMALTNHLVPPVSVAAAVRVMGRKDDVDKFAEAAGLTGEMAAQFKRRVLVQRTARSFDAERGEYVLEDRVTIPVLSKADIDVRAAIYHGMRMNASEQRLVVELRARGSWFLLYPEQASHVERFDFGPDADPIIAALRGGTSVAELDALHRELDPRLVLAVLTALASCHVVTPIESRLTSAQEISLPRTPTPRAPTISRVPTQRQPMSSSTIPVEVSSTPRFASGSAPRIARGTYDADKTVMRPAKLSQPQIRQLIQSRLVMLERGVDLFTFLGVPFGAPTDHVRAAYLEIARYLRPERLAEAGIHDDRDEARTVFAQAVIAMTTLTDDNRRADYLSAFSGGARARS